MARLAVRLACDEAELAALRTRANSKTMQRRIVQRAKLILLNAEGKTDSEIAMQLGMDPNTVATWRKRFISDRLERLVDAPRSEKPPICNLDQTRLKILDMLKKAPQKGKPHGMGKPSPKSLGCLLISSGRRSGKVGSTRKGEELGASAPIPNSP